MHASMTPFQAILLFAALWFAQLVGGVPVIVSETRRDVASPPVLVPNASTVWVIGEPQTVLWDTSNLPKQITNPLGRVLLGFLDDTSDSFHLMIDSPLASGFDITSGSVDILVPDVEPRTDYIIVLMGDSGNRSDRFTIANSTTSNSSTTSSSPTIPASTSGVTGSTVTQASTSELGSLPESTSSLQTPSSAHVVTFTDASTVAGSPTATTLESLSSQASILLSESIPAAASEGTSTESDTSAALMQGPSLELLLTMILMLWAFILV